MSTPSSLMSVLREARWMIATPETWVAQGYAANAEGRRRMITSPDAVRFTAFGALIRACRGSNALLAEAKRIFGVATPALFDKMVYADEELTHAESVELFDRAVAFLKPLESPSVAPKSGVVVASRIDASLSGLPSSFLQQQVG